MQRNIVLIKVQAWNKLYITNCVTWTEILLVSFLMYVIFHITPGLLIPGKSLTTLEHQHPCPILLELYYSSPPPVKTIKNLKLMTKFKHGRHIDQELYIFLMQMLKAVSILFINNELVRTVYSVGFLSNL